MKDRYWGTVRCLCDKFRVKGHKCHLTCTPMFPAVLLTAAKTWKQPEHLSTDGWIKKTWCVYTVECYSAMKKNEIVPFAATWMDLEMIVQSKVSQKDKYYTVSLVRPKIWHKWTYLWNRKTHRRRKQTSSYQGEWEGIGLGTCDQRLQAVLYRMDEKTRSRSTAQELQYSPIYNKPQWKEYEKEHMCVHRGVYNWIALLYASN